MNPPALTPTPIDGLIIVAAGYTPTTHVHLPNSTFSRYFWTPSLGPTAYLAWSTIVAWLPDDDTPITVNYDELAYGLGTAPGRLTKALARLATFRLSHVDPTSPSTLHVKRRAPQLSPRQLERLAFRCPTLAACHDEHIHTAV